MSGTVTLINPPTDAELRRSVEAKMQLAFDNVRIAGDTGSAAAGAAAYTRGKDVNFAAGAYAPGSAAGKQLLAHELTHVMQQRGGTAY